MPPPLPSQVNRGDPITAELVNGLLDEVRRLRTQLDAMSTDGAGWLVRGIVEGRTITGSGTPTGALASEVTYTIRLLGRDQVETFGADRLFGRPVADDSAKLVPAAVGSRALVAVFPNGGSTATGGGAWVVLAMVDERLAFAECAP